jgi:transposase
MENQLLVSPSRQCTSTSVGLFKDLLANNNVAALYHPPYSPDLAAAVFYLFPRLKSALKGQPFCNVSDMIKNAWKEPKSLSLLGMFPTTLQSL